MKGSVPITDFNFDSLQDSENLDLNNLTKTLENKPLVVTFSEGKGQVLYTTFHNEAQKTSDTESVLNWFAVRAKAGKLSQAVQELITKDGNEVLQEIVDSINQGETKKYLFGASGEADFQIILNFGGSKLSLKITDPNGKEVASQTVSSPPYTKSIDATKGNYEIEIKGVEVPEKNYPFVVAVGGPEEAMVKEDSGKPTTVSPSPSPKTAIEKLLGNALVLGATVAGAVILLVIIIIVIVVVMKKKGAKPVPPAPENKEEKETKEEKTSEK